MLKSYVLYDTIAYFHGSINEIHLFMYITLYFYFVFVCVAVWYCQTVSVYFLKGFLENRQGSQDCFAS